MDMPNHVYDCAISPVMNNPLHARLFMLWMERVVMLHETHKNAFYCYQMHPAHMAMGLARPATGTPGYYRLRGQLC